MSDDAGTAVPTQRDHAYALLRGQIVTCEREPGALLSERALAAETGLGLASVRAALARLAADGLVVALPRRGYRVTPLTPRGVEELLEVWSIVGPQLLRLGIARATARERRAIAAGFARVERAASRAPGRETALRITDESAATFALVAAAAGNARLQGLLDALAADLMRVWTLTFAADPGIARMDDPEFWTRAIVDDVDLATVAERSHRTIAAAAARISDAVRRWPSVQAVELRGE